MRNIFDLEPHTQVLQDDSYIISYPHILSYFSGLKEIRDADVVRGAHMVYGWMPTVLDLYPESPNKTLIEIAELLTQAKNKNTLSKTQIQDIASVVNNSLVGASKLLHFVVPHKYAIWDSKIYAFVHEKKAYNYRVNDVDLYVKYLEALEELEGKEQFGAFHRSVNGKIGYDVSCKRAIELIMFLNSPELGG
ncbi:MAG: hypothetical protein P1U64_05745 [Alcanivoracaceae bacterium]|nr:hypothetical protein [Alcanivoracaceae bacterium]